jgi:hypothetical protein
MANVSKATIRSDVGQKAVAGLATAAEGAVEGEKLKEDKRRFNETLEEQRQQFDSDLKFRMGQLATMVDQGVLDRDQAQLLQGMQQRHEEKKQEKDISQMDLSRRETFTWQGGENDEDRNAAMERLIANLRQSETESRRSASVNLTGQRRDLEARSRQLEFNRDVENRRSIINIGDELLAGRNWDAVPPEEQDRLSMLMARNIVGPDRWDNPGEAAATQAEKVTALQRARRSLMTHTEQKRVFEADIKGRAMQEAYGGQAGQYKAAADLGEDASRATTTGTLSAQDSFGLLEKEGGGSGRGSLAEPDFVKAEGPGSKLDQDLGIKGWNIEAIYAPVEDGGLGRPDIGFTIDLIEDLMIDGVLTDAAKGSSVAMNPVEVDDKVNFWKDEVVRIIEANVTDEQWARRLTSKYKTKIDAIYTVAYSSTPEVMQRDPNLKNPVMADALREAEARNNPTAVVE